VSILIFNHISIGLHIVAAYFWPFIARLSSAAFSTLTVFTCSNSRMGSRIRLKISGDIMS